MTELLASFGSALWLGILTSISPCPLATNVAAVSFIARKVSHPGLVLASGAAYTTGRMISYAVIGIILVNSLLSVPQVAQFLQKYMNRAVGPLLVATGLVLLGIIKLKAPAGFSLSQKGQDKLAGAGIPGAFLLGMIFALAFCPLSAALFFGSLIPLAINSKNGAALPLVYGVGTGLPVLIFAFAIALGVASLSLWFKRLTRMEYYMRMITGIVFILAGSYHIYALY
ncbi:MAG: aromatic aminobenezylarsenical efflux permease ArsG family transporter [Candidatus Omnitrophica bacterium]|nr:aromatic aminobenezylarsenical efflux permease ArsG family transporter [Candidatus Omnitrophota bacterium]MDD5737102.1 aromatic aminobenezylarsenical efflux permease ArsG family transporter [Candidatus Omnitrophota bacterium]